MRIGLAYNLRQESSESQAELLTEKDIERLTEALKRLEHTVIPIEVTGTSEQIVDRLISARPELIFNVAEGVNGRVREAYYPAIYRMLSLPFTGSDASTLFVGLDKRLTEELLLKVGIRVPRGALITKKKPDLPEDMIFPLIIKPNYEGSSKGISQDSIVEDRAEAESCMKKLLAEYPQGLTVEQYIRGREVTVPWLGDWPGGLLEVVEWEISHSGEHYIIDYEIKHQDKDEQCVHSVCPAKLTPQQRHDVLTLAEREVRAMNLLDFGRVDIRLAKDGTPYLLEVNALPGLHPTFSMMVAAREKGLSFEDVLALIVRSAARRYGLQIEPSPLPRGDYQKRRRSVREANITIGRFSAGAYNAITDVEGIKVGHVTHIKNVDKNDEQGKTTLRTGITAIVPSLGDDFNNHLVAGGFILNGIGEMSGLTQAMEWGWLETPILLTNTLSIGVVHQGIIQYMLKKHPELGRKLTVTIPLIGETDDSFLNDVRIDTNSIENSIEAIESASDGPVEQGSVGGGTGMISFDFAGGIGSASRVLPRKAGGYTIGVLVQSNFGKMRNLTIEGNVVGKKLDTMYPYEHRRVTDLGSVIVILATDAPLLSNQLTQLSKRAALGLGRAGSHAAATSGEIIFAFSTANRTSRLAKEKTQLLNLSFVTEKIINYLYEAAVEVTEEAVLNAMFCSGGMDGRMGRMAPPIPTDIVLEILGLKDKA
jgi:D-alanine--D-alanine ligase